MSDVNLRSRIRLAWQVLRGAPIARTSAAPRQSALQLGLSRSLDEFFTDESQWQAAGLQQNPREKSLATQREDLTNALAAWRTNPLARRIVNLTRDHVWGTGIRVASKNGVVDRWLERFWNHELNRMEERLPVWVDALTTDGELFPTFHTNPAGQTYIRALTAIQIEDIQWKANDYEQLTRIGQRIPNDLELHYWPTVTEARPDQSAAWQYAVNRPLGVIRGDGDLTTALPWLAYYSDWLDSRANRGRVMSNFYYEVVVQNAEDVAAARARYAAPPLSGSVVVHSQGEEHKVQQPKIGSEDARFDGNALRLMIATAGNVPIHWLSEPGEGNSESTSNNMNDVSYRFYATRQRVVQRMIEHVCLTSYRRAAALGHIRNYTDPGIFTIPPDISKNDNTRLSQSARAIAEAFGVVLQNNLDTDERVIGLIYKFCGEVLTESEINEIVARARNRQAEAAAAAAAAEDDMQPADPPPTITPTRDEPDDGTTEKPIE